MPQLVTFSDKLAFWRGTKRFTDGQRNTVEIQTNAERVARQLETDGRSDSTSRLANTTNQPTDARVTSQLGKAGGR